MRARVFSEQVFLLISLDCRHGRPVAFALLQSAQINSPNGWLPGPGFMPIGDSPAFGVRA
jgi:hypothetical protein